MSQDTCQVRGTNLLVALLVVLFAISSWVDINGMFVELPILTQKLPEGWNLPSYMAVTIQMANVAPFAYTAIRTVCPRYNIEIPVIYGIISIGILSCFLLVFFWDTTAVVAGSVHSVGLLSLQFFLALVDCTSSVAYLSFMATFKPWYLPAFYVGEGIGGLLPSLTALVQGAGEMRCVNETILQNVTVNGTTTMEVSFTVYPKYETPRFSVEIFFVFLTSMLVISCIAFSMLNFWRYVQKEKVDVEWERRDGLTTKQSSPDVSYRTGSDWCQNGFLTRSTSGETCSQELDFISQSLPPSPSTDIPNGDSDSAECTTAEGVGLPVQRRRLQRSQYWTLMLLTAWVNWLVNGTLPSIQSYSCLPYGIDTYHLAMTLSTITNPVACFCLFFVQAKSVRSVSALSVLGSVLAAYVLYTAASSPSPPLSRHALGSASVVTAWVLVVFFLTYTKISIAAILREEGRRALLWCGAFTQIGSLVGALVTFVFVNVYGVFQQASLCA
ncbi:riboflavin transporter 2-like [Babylonia areolata]|uniref:riboflavin transporter 2-like n=1 Tax=Babylonia areolata TaxID=304850 RepID=UPI003FD4452F